MMKYPRDEGRDYSGQKGDADRILHADSLQRQDSPEEDEHDAEGHELAMRDLHPGATSEMPPPRIPSHSSAAVHVAKACC